MSEKFLKSEISIRATVFFILVALLLSVSVSVFYERPSFIFFDSLQKSFPLQQQEQVALIVVDQFSIDQLATEGVVFPLPRQIYGAVAEIAKKIEAKAIVYDLIFTEQSSYGNDDDELFAKLIQDSKIPSFFPAASVNGSVKEPIAILKKMATGLGAVNYENDVDGVFRRVPNFLIDQGEPRLSTPELVFRFFNGGKSSADKELLRNYNGQAIEQISLYSVLKIYREMQDGKALSIDLSHLKNKIWIIGYSAPGLHDLKPMAVDKEAPGMLISATGIANRFAGEGLQKISLIIQFVFCFFFAVFSVLLIKKLDSPMAAGVGLVVMVCVLPVAAMLLFWQFNYWFTPTGIMSSAFVAGSLQLMWNFKIVWRDRLKLAKSLQHSMSPEMLELIRSGKVKISRFGEEREITVMFADLAGYTSLSEVMTPEQMVSMLNSYLDDVTGVILKNSGYVDKFIGDAVMVLWGAPVKQSNHAQLALGAVKKYQEVCDLFNLKMKLNNPEFQELITRVGLHTGTAIVGNIGAKERHNYTAIGDAVNLASRLEGMGKNYNLKLIMSAEFVNAAQALNFPYLLEVDTIIVKGKTEPTKIYTFLSENTDLKYKEAYHKGLQAYYNKDWHTAVQFFMEAAPIEASVVMLARCQIAIEKGFLKKFRNGAWVYDAK